jgi:hypothetical protein
MFCARGVGQSGRQAGLHNAEYLRVCQRLYRRFACRYARPEPGNRVTLRPARYRHVSLGGLVGFILDRLVSVRFRA